MAHFGGQLPTTHCRVVAGRLVGESSMLSYRIAPTGLVTVKRSKVPVAIRTYIHGSVGSWLVVWLPQVRTMDRT